MGSEHEVEAGVEFQNNCVLRLWCKQVPRKFTSSADGKMGYEDFVWFILSEEDKSSEPSLEYWWAPHATRPLPVPHPSSLHFYTISNS